MGFFTPWFLAGALAVGLPIWLHLLKKHKTTPLPFSSLMFFERRIQSSIKHRRLRYLVLLALRMALVVLIALPLYSNAAGTIPIVQALLGKGMPLGTTLSFMMAITAISLPEFIILRRVIRWPLIAVFATVVTIGVLCIGYLFNFLIP